MAPTTLWSFIVQHMESHAFRGEVEEPISMEKRIFQNVRMATIHFMVAPDQ